MNCVIFYLAVILFGITVIEHVLSNDKTDVTNFRERLLAGICPDIVEESQVHSLAVGLELQYPNCSPVLGTLLKPSVASRQPITRYFFDEEEYFTLIVTDPDAPSRADPKYKELLHWLVVNIPEMFVDKGECIVPYLGPRPENGTGIHRYCCLLLSQGNTTKKFSEPKIGVNDIEQRKYFSTRAFMNKYDLRLVTHGNYFTSEFEESNTTIPDSKKVL